VQRKFRFDRFLKAAMAGALLFGVIFSAFVILGVFGSFRAPGWLLFTAWAAAMSFIVAFVAHYLEMRRHAA